jgi:hypothetical protein
MNSFRYSRTISVAYHMYIGLKAEKEIKKEELLLSLGIESSYEQRTIKQH